MSTELTVTASSILFGFLFAGFWWALDRELTFKSNERHFKFGYFLLLLTMIVLAIGGILGPLWVLNRTDPSLTWTFGSIAVAILGAFGYMLTEFGHYSIFQRPKYATTSEKLSFWLTIAAMVVVGLWVSLRATGWLSGPVLRVSDPAPALTGRRTFDCGGKETGKVKGWVARESLVMNCVRDTCEAEFGIERFVATRNDDGRYTAFSPYYFEFDPATGEVQGVAGASFYYFVGQCRSR